MKAIQYIKSALKILKKIMDVTDILTKVINNILNFKINNYIEEKIKTILI